MAVLFEQLVAAIAIVAMCAVQSPPVSKEKAVVNEGVFVSSELPRIRLRVEEKLKYLGSFPFDIDGIAGGYRYAWGEAGPDKHLKRMFIVQQEGFYPSSSDSYRYGMPRPVQVGSNSYEHDLHIFDNSAEIRENPGKETERTKEFLDKRGYSWDAQVVMSRFARIVGAAHKNEIIFFYFENLSDHTAKTAAELALVGNAAEKQSIQASVDANSRRAFRVEEEER